MGPDAPQVLKYSGTKPGSKSAKNMEPAIKEFLYDLLNALVVNNGKTEEGMTKNISLFAMFSPGWYN